MAYRALVHNFVDQRNQICRSYEADRLLQVCFRSDILPELQEHSAFHPSEIFGNLYLTEREWVDDVEAPESSAPHESHIDRIFWDKRKPRKPICILGPVGSGKSTLIKYYLWCHCPHSGVSGNDYDKKLVLFFDIKTIQDNTDFYHDFFLLMQATIRHRCERKNFNIDYAIKRRETQPTNVRQWVRAALEELSKLPNKPEDVPKSPFNYIVLVLDNLDQTPIDVQVRAITEIEQWLATPTIRLWQVILPMWPSTFAKLKNHEFNLLRGATKFTIGTIHTNPIINSREAAFLNALQAKSSNAATTTEAYFSDLKTLAEDRLSLRIHALSHGNLRQMLSLWESFICSEPAFRIWKQYQASKDTRRSFDYELLDALIIGTHDALNHEDHRIANVFAMGHASVWPRDLLIGPHAIHLLSQHHRTKESFYDSLTGLGYSERNIAEVEKSLMKFNFFHQTPGSNNAIEYELHYDVIMQYESLLSEPAYLDNIALVTPVDPTFLPRMSKTRGDRADDFVRRVETTLAFLEFLRTCEIQFRSSSQIRWGTPDRFASTLQDSTVPCIWRKMSIRYLDRLTGLRSSGFLKSVEETWWDSMISNPLFIDSVLEEEFLSPIA